MARPKYDIVIEAAHYAPDGSLVWVRGYERRGAAFSDSTIWTRENLIQALRDGKRVVTGQRKPFWGHSFETGHIVRLLNQNGGGIITTRQDTPAHDDLENLPRL